MKGLKIQNQYVDCVRGERAPGNLFEACPKAVWAAVAISALTDGGDRLEEAHERVVAEWWSLHDAGIVPQRPPFGRK